MRIVPPYFGAAWYPEVWPQEQWESDIARMRQAGFNVMRLGEFAWSRMEPSEGDFQFDWLETALAKLSNAGIAAILCTPTATPPAWLMAGRPELFKMTASGRRLDAGYRLYACPNQALFIEHIERVVSVLAERFGRDERVIGWQVDNETFGACFCPICEAAFHDWLRRRYGTIEALNEAWGTGVWSHTYADWGQVPVPRYNLQDDPVPQTHFYQPSLDIAWKAFTSHVHAMHIARQAELLRKRSTQPIGSNMMPYLMIDYHQMHQSLDLVQFDHYNNAENLWEASFWFDFCRPHKRRPFWNMETSTCWTNGFYGGVLQKGFCTANSWLPIALGAEANLYWLFRQHRSGREMNHGAVLNTAGRPLPIFDEVRELGRQFAAASDFLRAAPRRPAGLALHFSHHTVWARHAGEVCFSPLRDRPYFRFLLEDVYRPLMRAHWPMDVIQPAADISECRVLLSPHLATLDEAGLRGRLKAWIEAGGTWIVGPCSDDLTIDATKFTHAVYGSIEEWTGVRCCMQLPGFAGKDELFWRLRAADNSEVRAGVWFDALEPGKAETLATYDEGPFKGMAAITCSPFGKGRIVFLGTMPDSGFFARLVAREAVFAGLQAPPEASENVLVSPRIGKGITGNVVVEYEGRQGFFIPAGQIRNVLTGALCSGRITIPPYGALVLQDI